MNSLCIYLGTSVGFDSIRGAHASLSVNNSSCMCVYDYACVCLCSSKSPFNSHLSSRGAIEPITSGKEHSRLRGVASSRPVSFRLIHPEQRLCNYCPSSQEHRIRVESHSLSSSSAPPAGDRPAQQWSGYTSRETASPQGPLGRIQKRTKWHVLGQSHPNPLVPPPHTHTHSSQQITRLQGGAWGIKHWFFFRFWAVLLKHFSSIWVCIFFSEYIISIVSVHEDGVLSSVNCYDTYWPWVWTDMHLHMCTCDRHFLGI